MLNFLPALLCNKGYEKCLSYIGTEGRGAQCPAHEAVSYG